MQVNNHHAAKAIFLPVEVIWLETDVWLWLETDACTEVVNMGVCVVELSLVILTEHE